MHTCAILYAEDEEYDVLFLREAFVRAGITNLLQVVNNGRNAIEYVAGTGRYADRQKYPLPGIVLLDLNLPYRSGFEVLRWIRCDSQVKHTIVLIYTSSNQARDITMAYDLCANGYLLKSPDPDELDAMVRAIKEFWMIHNVLPLGGGQDLGRSWTKDDSSQAAV